jgi:poly(3-hydroxybutyrate) depolymerase
VDAREQPMSAGRFDLDDYIDYMREMFTFLAGDLHVFAVCQPSVPALAAIARMEAEGDPNIPHTLIMAGGPVDTRVSPTAVNQLAVEKGTDWFRRNVINSVPWPSTGFGRMVYPGFLQLTGFMTMNLDRHMKAHKDLFFHLVDGDGDGAEKHREFYDEYLAVMDLTAEFYLQTIETVFVEHKLPRGLMTHRGKPVDLGAIRRVGIMTIEGEKDDITGVGQCRAAIGLCHGVPEANKQHFECPRVGHYGIFNGSRFRSEIAPRMRHFMRRFDPATATDTPAAYVPASNVERLDDHRDKSRGRDNDAAAFSFPRRRDDQFGAAFAPAPEIAVAAAAPARALPFGMLAAQSAMRIWSATGRAVLESMAAPIAVRASKSK